MSTVHDAPGRLAPPGRRGRAYVSGSFFVSELALTFSRRRHQGLLVVLAAIPVMMGIALKSSAPGGGEDDPQFFAQVTGNGIFLCFASLASMLPFFLPLAVSVVSGDAIAGEAGIGTLRYLLAAPAGRTRLLFVKYGASVVFSLAGVLTVTIAALLTGLVLFPFGDVTLLSGTTVPYAEGLGRLALIAAYVTAGMAALAAIGMAVSTFTENPIGAIAATVGLAVGMQIVDVIPALSAVHPFLLTHWFTLFDGILRDPVSLAPMAKGLFVFGSYALVAMSVAWARFTTKDVTG